jgi:hypothetical protein
MRSTRASPSSNGPLRFERDDKAGQRAAKLEKVLALAKGDLREAVPLLAALLSIPTDKRYPPRGLTPPKQKERTLRALVAQVAGLAVQQPMLMLFEDAQWSDPTSLQLLDLVVDRASALPVLVIVTGNGRPGYPGWRCHGPLLRRSGDTKDDGRGRQARCKSGVGGARRCDGDRLAGRGPGAGR